MPQTLMSRYTIVNAESSQDPPPPIKNPDYANALPCNHIKKWIGYTIIIMMNHVLTM
jgi:hypothetical protein